jgi:RNA ligase
MFTLQEALEAIKNKPEFNCNKRDFGFVIDYNVTFKETFVGSTPRETLILQNLRGTCFNEGGAIIRLAYHKFHNLNENDEYRPELFDFSQPHDIEEKLDGSMIAPILIGDGYRLATRAGVTDVALKAEKFLLEMNYERYIKWRAYDKLIKDCLELGLTPIFEYCSRDQRIVIDYPEPKLILTGIRSMVTGRYLSLDLTDQLAEDHVDRVPLAVSEGSSINDLAAWVKSLQGQEGVVVKFADGRFVKIKAEDYVLKHRALDGLRFEKDVLALVLKNELDDVLPLVTPDVKERLVKYRDSVQHMLELHQLRMEYEYKSMFANSADRKGFAAQALVSPYKVGLFRMYEGKFFSLTDFAKTKTGSASSVEEIRWLIGPSYDMF